MAPRQHGTSLGRTFEAVVFDWDGTAVPHRQAPANAVRTLVEQLTAAGADVAVVSGGDVGDIDGQLGARPNGPGRLLLGLNEL
jgi:beta-phosphoglucomutase-like phosphatase (HAD superfamily)